MTDYYKVLQIDVSAEQEVVKAAYQRLANKYHPDRNAAPDATARMQALTAAYYVLGDADRRRQYDLTHPAFAKQTFRPQENEERSTSASPATDERPAPAPKVEPEARPSPPRTRAFPTSLLVLLCLLSGLLYWGYSHHRDEKAQQAEFTRLLQQFRDARKIRTTLRNFTFQWRLLENNPQAQSLEKMNDINAKEDVVVYDVQFTYRRQWTALDGRQGTFDATFWYGDFSRLDLRFDMDGHRFYCVYPIDSRGFTIPMNGAYHFCSSNKSAIVDARDAILVAQQAWRRAHVQVFEKLKVLQPYEANRLR